jgi:hypothetical protein
VDTLAFRNDSRLHHRGQPELYANWCLVMARAVAQFLRFACFAPAGPRLSPAGYAALVRRVTRRAPWRRPLGPEERIVVPGYASLHELSRHEERAVKAGLHGRLRSLLHWTNWRIAFPQPPGHQARVVGETLAELRAGRPVQLFLSDFPRISFNHSVLAFDLAATGPDAVDLVVYDPNDPAAPGVIRYDPAAARFRPVRLLGVDVPAFRAFRLYCSPFV